MIEQEANKIRKDILKASNNGVLDSVICSLLKEMQERVDYLKESRDYWVKENNSDKVMSYNTCITQMEDVISGYSNYI